MLDGRPVAEKAKAASLKLQAKGSKLKAESNAPIGGFTSTFNPDSYRDQHSIFSFINPINVINLINFLINWLTG